MDRHVLLRLLLSIVLLLSFAACTYPARLQGKSSPSDYIPIGQPSHSSDVIPSLYHIIPSGQPHSPSVSQIINMTFEQLPPSSPSISISLSQTTNLTQLPPSSTPLQLTVSVVSPSNFLPPTPPFPYVLVYNGTSRPGSVHNGTSRAFGPSSSPSNSPSVYNGTSRPGSVHNGTSRAFGPSSSPSNSPSVYNGTSGPGSVHNGTSRAFGPSSSPSNSPSAFAPVPPPSSPTTAKIPPPSSSPTTAKITPSAGVSRGGLNLLGKIGIAIAVIVVSLVILIAVLKAFKKAFHNDNDNDLGTGTDIRAYTTGQLANPGGNILDIRTHTVEELNSLEEGIDIRTYKMEELANATNNFTTEVGRGVSGSVYRAKLPGDRMGAVKRATYLDPSLFKQELSVLLRLKRHPHLVDLIGLCLEPGERILVFEFISNGNLHERLHKNKGVSGPLSWAARMDIAYQVAVALQYLHEEAKPPILHRDVKSANVLLVDDHCAKLADFGLSKLGPKNHEFTNTLIRGTRGYMDPKYMKTGRYSAKSDVYSFGVVLLELITGLKSLHEDTPLAEWTQPYRSEGIDRFITIVDQNMRPHINMMQLQNMIKIVNVCLAEISEERSSMREILNMMQETRNLKANGNLSDGGEAPLLGAEAEAPGAEAEI